MTQFDPNSFSLKDSGLFGMPYSAEESDIVILPVPWDVTVSYASGTAKAPKAIMEASKQVDLFHTEFPDVWKLKVALLEVHMEWYDLNKHYRKKAEQAINLLVDGMDSEFNDKLAKLLVEVNDQCAELMGWVQDESRKLIADGKLVGVMGGDHSSPLGLMCALAETHADFGVLQVDAHADLRVAYEGFSYSHASIMQNAMNVPQISRLVQVGIRDLCEAEMEAIKESNGRIISFMDKDIQASIYRGSSWDRVCDDIIEKLPQKVYISLDIDGLDPKECPNTGTPVPGGPDFGQVAYLLSKLGSSGRTIIGFDLCEVALGDDDWDANVGARVLFELCVQLARTNGIRPV